MPEVDREERVSSGEYCYEIQFCLVRSFCERRHELVLNFLCYEVLAPRHRVLKMMELVGWAKKNALVFVDRCFGFG